MTIAQGNNLISKLYLGSTEVLKAYLGTIQVYPNTEPTPTVQYIPNNAITIFPNYEALTTNNGRFPNGTSYNLNNAPSSASVMALSSSHVRPMALARSI